MRRLLLASFICATLFHIIPNGSFTSSFQFNLGLPPALFRYTLALSIKPISCKCAPWYCLIYYFAIYLDNFHTSVRFNRPCTQNSVIILFRFSFITLNSLINIKEGNENSVHLMVIIINRSWNWLLAVSPWVQPSADKLLFRGWYCVYQWYLLHTVYINIEAFMTTTGSLRHIPINPTIVTVSPNYIYRLKLKMQKFTYKANW